MPRTQSRPEPEQGRTVALVTLGCARNEVDSEELAGRLEAAGWRLVDDAVDADVAVVNTCGFVEQAKKDSIDTVLEAADLRADGATRTRAVVAVGCLAERYGRDLEQALPEADAVLGFDSYADLASHLDAVLHGERPAAHVPRDRRALLPLAPAARTRDGAVSSSSPVQGDPCDPTGDGSPPVGAPPSGPPVVRKRLDGRPWAPLKLASGCDRRCAFCAIPMFRGAFVSRRPTAVLTEAAWLADQGVREIFLVSENSTSYGKDLGDLRLLETVLPQLAAVPGLHRVRVSYLQPAEVRPGLVHAIATTPGVAPYFDLSFQHGSPAVLRRMRRFGGTTEFLALIGKIRAIAPTAGIRSNVIVGFPGETEADVAELEAFLTDARLDVVGVFGYSDEDGTEAADLDGKIDPEAVAARVTRVGDLVEQLTAQRALDRVGELVEVIVEGFDNDQSDVEDDEDDETGAPGDGGARSGSTPFGRAAHQGPDVDGVTLLPASASGLRDGGALRPGDVVLGRVLDARGADLVAAVESVVVRAGEALVMEPVG